MGVVHKSDTPNDLGLGSYYMLYIFGRTTRTLISGSIISWDLFKDDVSNHWFPLTRLCKTLVSKRDTFFLRYIG